MLGLLPSLKLLFLFPCVSISGFFNNCFLLPTSRSTWQLPVNVNPHNARLSKEWFWFAYSCGEAESRSVTMAFGTSLWNSTCYVCIADHGSHSVQKIHLSCFSSLYWLQGLSKLFTYHTMTSFRPSSAGGCKCSLDILGLKSVLMLQRTVELTAAK